METPRDRRARQAVFVLSAGALAGVLIWSKLRLVTDIPRSAYAVPENHAPHPEPAPSIEDGVRAPSGVVDGASDEGVAGDD